MRSQRYLLERLAQVPGLRVVGPPEADARGGLASFTIDGIHPHDIAELADRVRASASARDTTAPSR